MFTLLLLFPLACAQDVVSPAPAAPDSPPPPALPATIRFSYPPPAGAARVETDAWGDWLRDLALREVSTPVRTYQGKVVPHSNARVVELPLVDGNLQQCADSLIRLRAEWQRATGQDSAISFHATSGDPMPWSRYQAGERAYEKQNRLAWKTTGTPASWEEYLAAVFMWAGTRSLDSDTTRPASPAPGDLLVLPGAPGHAVAILDVARREGESPATFLLVGEGFMPAQDFHLELGPNKGWWVWEGGLQMGYWDFPQTALRRWK